MHCRADDYAAEWGPRTLVYCDCCMDSCVHVGCLQEHDGVELTEEGVNDPSFAWYCSEARAAPAAAAHHTDSASPARPPREQHIPSPDTPAPCQPLAGATHHPGMLTCGSGIVVPLAMRPRVQDCRRVGTRLVELTGQMRSLDGGSAYTVGLVRYSESNSGGNEMRGGLGARLSLRRGVQQHID